MRKRSARNRLRRLFGAASASRSEAALADLAVLHLGEAIAETRQARERLERTLRQLGR